MRIGKKNNAFADPIKITNLEECFFYHTVDIPGYGVINGDWDLRGKIKEYLGNVNFEGKKVLEVGTANGALCFEMEKYGASVIAFDLSKDYSWDVIPNSSLNAKDRGKELKISTEKLNNAFWLHHNAVNSNARVVYGNLYEIPKEIGLVDIITYGAVLLHVRDPFLALQKGLRFAREKVIITELLGDENALEDTEYPVMKLMPNKKDGLKYLDAWWRLYPNVIINILGLLGFEDTTVSYHTQEFRGSIKKMFTVVGERTNSYGLLD